MEENLCTGCEGKLDADALFCNSCGMLQNQIVSAEPKIQVETKQCPQCKNNINNDVRFCSKCAFDFSVTQKKEDVVVSDLNIEQKPNVERNQGLTGNIAKGELNPNHSPNLVHKVKNRYKDGYRVANTISAFGLLIKIVSMIAGIITCLVGTGLAVAVAEQARRSSFGFSGGESSAIVIVVFFFVIGFIIAGVGWVLGVIISANGQMVKASLDGAVNSSPFLEDIDRADIMSLSFGGAKQNASNVNSQQDEFFQTEEKKTIPINFKAMGSYGLSFIFGILWLPAPIYFLITERIENRYVRFHAVQSLLIMIGGLIIYLVGIVPISFISGTFGSSLGVIYFFAYLALQMFCLWKTYNEENFKVPVLGDIALRLANSSNISAIIDRYKPLLFIFGVVSFLI